jgi:S1-C subfamily serine protease
MTALPLPVIFLISCLLVGMLQTAGPVCHADDVMLRKAATPSTSRSLPAYRTTPADSAREAQNRGRIGLSPVPFKPERSEPRPEDGADARSAGTLNRFAGFPDIRDLVKRVNESVVSIRMLDAGSSWSIGSLGLSGDPGAKATGYGSGFIVSKNGHIITNEHVLRNGSQIEVELLDGRKTLAKLVHKDGKNDLALLKIDADNLHPIRLGDSDGVELGEWVVGIGNPYGIGQSIMIGIVSAQNRSIPGSGYPPLIQIDAAMNLGNSGGPLFNMNGEVIGINTILLWKSQGIGFATPINVAREFLERKTRHQMKAASAASLGPQGPISDEPRAMSGSFNPLDPPWKFGR